MFPILKTIVNYVIGDKKCDNSGKRGESVGINCQDSIEYNKQLNDKSKACRDLQDEKLTIAELEKEIQAIEGWSEEKGISEETVCGKKEKWDLNYEVEVLNKNCDVEIQTKAVTHNENKNCIEIHVSTSEEKNTESQPDLELCEHRIGTVTKLSKEYGIIDKELQFDCQIHQTTDLQEGSRVNYVVFRTHIDEKWQLHKLVSTTDENWEEKQKDTQQEIVKKSGALKRKMIGQVESRFGQQIFVKPNIKFSLDNIKADFIPYEGDWVSLNALVELDEDVQDFVGDVLAVYDIQPLRSRVMSGYVTFWDDNKKEGIIDKNIWFTLNECEPGYDPTVESAVAVQAIESSHRMCTWRALSVTSLVKKDSNVSKAVNEPISKKVITVIKNGISLPRKVQVGRVSCGQTKEFTIEMCNLGKDSHLLLRGRFHGKRSESQITLLSKVGDGTIISAGQNITYRFHVYGRFVGQNSEVFVFTFKGFKMTCFIDYEVQDQNMLGLIEHNNFEKRKWMDKYARERKRELNGRNGILMKGVMPKKPPAFVPVRVGTYTIPDYMWKAVLGDDNTDCSSAKIISRLGEVVPSLKRELSASNYSARFHALLHLEEIDMNINMRQYDMQGVTLSFAGEYLSMEVPGLAEKRPSVLIGDRVNVESSKYPGPIYEGFVHKVCANELWLKFHSQFHQTYESEECSVQFIINRGPIRRCHVGVDLALKHLGENVLFPTSVIIQEPQLNLLPEDTDDAGPSVPYNYKIEHLAARSGQLTVRKMVTKDGKPLYTESGKQYLPSLPAPKISKNAVKLKWINSQLNHCQKEAVRNALKGVARPLPYVIFGPPGTGKTVTLVETILQIYSLIPDSRILVATPSNSSANLIAERLLLSRLLCPGDLVRLVAYHCLEEGTLPEILLPYSTTCDISSPQVGDFCPVTYKLKKSSNASVLGRHRITVGTCVALGQLYCMGFPSGHFTHVCVDEAGQATEPELLIPLGFLHKDWGQAILAGDPLQLGPIVNSCVGKHFGFGYSYLARLLDTFPYQREPCGYTQSGGFNPDLVTRLVMNYRSLPEILNLPSSLFYDSQLQPQVQISGREGAVLKLLTKFLPKRDTALPPSIVFHGVRGRNLRDSDCPSWFNPQELVQIMYYLKDFFDAGLTPDDIGVITPYQKQVQKLRSLLNQLELPSPKIGSVEEFQGQERLVILLSTVRSAPKYIEDDLRHALGFVASPQRLNVALTRARALLIIVGNPHLLSRDIYWKSTIAYCIEQNSFIGCDVPQDFMDLNMCPNDKQQD